MTVTLTVPSLEEVDRKASSGEKQQWLTGSKWPNMVFCEDGLLRFHNYRNREGNTVMQKKEDERRMKRKRHELVNYF